MVRFAAAALALAMSFVGVSAHGGQIMLLNFSSPTCGPCRQMEPLIHSFQQANYPIRKVDTSAEPELAAQYNITRVPCFVMLVDGREVSRTIGAVDSSQLQQLFQQARELVIAGQPRSQSSPVPTQLQERDVRGEIPSPRAEPQPPEPPATTAGLSSKFAALLGASVRLKVEDPQGRSFGTGTIIDARQGEALVITCGHLFRESKGKGPVTVELFEATPGGVRAAGLVSGLVLSYDLDRDVALVAIRPGRPVPVAQIAPAGTAIDRGDRVVSIGCSNGDDPTAIPTRITVLDRYQGPPNIETSGAPVEGRSGGGLFNDQGQLIGVCYAADYEGNEGLYAALESIHDEVARLNLNPIDTTLASNDPRSPAKASSPDSLINLPPVVRGQDSLPSDVPPPNREPITPLGPRGEHAAGPNGAQPAAIDGLNEIEQATWEEIMNRPSSSEVIIIVRPHEPGGESEMFRIDRASPAFIRALEAGRGDTAGHKLR